MGGKPSRGTPADKRLTENKRPAAVKPTPQRPTSGKRIK